MTANEGTRLEARYGLRFDMGGDPPSPAAIEVARRKVSLDRGQLERWQSVRDQAVQAGGWIVYASIAAGVVAFVISSPIKVDFGTAVLAAIVATMAWAILHATSVAIVTGTDEWIGVNERLAENWLDLLALTPLSELRSPENQDQWQRWVRQHASIHGYNDSLLAMGREPVKGEWDAARLWVQEKKTRTNAPERRFGT